MANRSRHLATASPASPSAPRSPRAPLEIPFGDDPFGIRWPRVSSVVHRLLRVPPPTQRPEWREPRPVANKRDSAPVGELRASSNVVALFREGGLPNIGRRS